MNSEQNVQPTSESGNSTKPVLAAGQSVCPCCGADWDDGDIYERLRNHEAYKNWSDEKVREAAGHYGWAENDKKRFSRLIGVEDSSIYDGISWWQCPDCKQLWDRWSGKPCG